MLTAVFALAGLACVSRATGNDDRLAPDATAIGPVPVGFCDLVTNQERMLDQTCSETAFEASLKSGHELIAPHVGLHRGELNDYHPSYGSEYLPPPGTDLGAQTMAAPVASTSATAHENASIEEAKNLFAATYAPLLDNLTATPLSPDNIVTYFNRRAAIVDPGPGAPNQLVDSTLPLTPSVDSTRLVDLSVDETMHGFEVARPLVQVEMPESSEQETRLEASGVGLTYASTPNADTGSAAGSGLSGQGVFYAEADTDTDLFVSPRPTGFEVFAQLRTARSPQRLAFDVGLPTTATVQPGDGGEFNVTQDGELIAQVTPPEAINANGEPVPIEARLDGKTITIEVPHDDSDAYPILVDPEVVDIYDWPTGSTFEGWRGAGNDPDYQRTQWTSSLFAPGLYNQAMGQQNFDAGSVSLWYYTVPHLSDSNVPTSYIADAYFGDAQFAAGSGPVKKPRMVLGLWSQPFNRWVRALDWNSSFSTTSLSLADSAALRDGSSPNEAKRLDFQLYVPANSGTATPTDTKTGRVSNAVVHLTDPEAPTVQMSNLPDWTNGSGQLHLETSATDPGLGIKTQTLVRGWGVAGGLTAGEQTSVSSCDGTARRPCAQEAQYSYDFGMTSLREGLQLAMPVTWDAKGAGTIPGTWYGIDRTAPRPQSVTRTAGDDLEVVATDGMAGSRDLAVEADLAGAESGVSKVELLRDGDIVQSETQTCSDESEEGVPWRSCSMTATFNLSPDAWEADGELAVRVTDAVGNARQFGAKPKLTVTGDAFTAGTPLVGAENDLDIQLLTEVEVIARVAVTVDGTLVAEREAADLMATGECDAMAVCELDVPIDADLSTEASGIHDLAVTATTTGGVETSVHTDIRLDSEPPELTVTGSLTENDGLTMPSGGDMEALAVDDSALGDSGISDIALQIDAPEMETTEDRVLFHSSCASEQCPSQARGTYNYSTAEWGDGAMDLLVIAEDAAGNVSETPLKVNSPAVHADPACDAVPPTTVNQPMPSTVAEATDDIESAVPEAIEAGDPYDRDESEEPPLDPLFVQSSAEAPNPDEVPGAIEQMELAVEGNDVGGAASDKLADGFALAQTACLTPSRTTDAALPAQLTGTSSVPIYANSDIDTDTAVRAMASGVALVQVSGELAPATQTWDVSLDSGAELVPLSDGQVAIVSESEGVSESHAWPGAAPAAAQASAKELLADVEAQDLEANYELDRAEYLLNKDVEALIAVPEVTMPDGGAEQGSLAIAEGNRVRVSLPVQAQGSDHVSIVLMRSRPDRKDCHVGNSPCGDYRAGAAVDYARRWGEVPNYQKWYDYGGNDCTNFMSQILLHGGLKQMREKKHGNGSWWTKSWLISGNHSVRGRPTSQSWVRADTLARHLWEYALAFKAPLNPDRWKGGDLVVMRGPGDQNWDHFQYVTRRGHAGSGGSPRVAQHSSRDYSSWRWKTVKKIENARYGAGGWDYVVLRPRYVGANIGATKRPWNSL